MSAWIEQIISRSDEARVQSAQHPIAGQFVDLALPIPKPFMGMGEIKLVVIGQDPTIKHEASRQRITTVLNLNTRGSLTRYLTTICEMLDFDLTTNVYATNVCKCFFNAPPTAIRKVHGVDVLAETAIVWLPLLCEELAQFPQATVISLGEPALNLLVRDGGSRLMKDYWGFTKAWRDGEKGMLSGIPPQYSAVGRWIFPFPHQPSISKQFYRERLSRYTAFVRAAVGI